MWRSFMHEFDIARHTCNIFHAVLCLCQRMLCVRVHLRLLGINIEKNAESALAQAARLLLIYNSIDAS